MSLDFLTLDFFGSVLGVALTLLVLSYLIRDHFLLRFLLYGYVGLMAGFAVVLAFNILYPSLILPILADPIGGITQLAIPLALCSLLFLKAFPRLSPLGNLSLAFLVGVGLAALIGGAIQGTLIPQIRATIQPFDIHRQATATEERLSGLVQGLLILLGTITTLAYFHFGARPQVRGGVRRAEWIESLSRIGQLLIAIALGLIFAGLLKAGFVALIERTQALLQFVITLQRGL
ncbi:MAG: hypothetical protein RML93_01970 [Anaerolineales bacterium]|nr:hypothetical protein [Anaerolineales bacterium]MCS7248791.1 hypothetical protein [Anaerolineales bacterium]MDW8162604.1 hypothetical protein [Anaerolineales bacterium]MDW8446040.1 hypothetical protein [Anaerolineales bacterium]